MRTSAAFFLPSMRIGVDASRANHLRRTGVEWYAYHLLCELASLPESARHEWMTYAATPLVSDLKARVSGWTERCLSWPPRYLWTQMRLSCEMRWRPPDALFIPAHALPRILPRKTVVTMHDVGFRRFREAYKPFEGALHDIYARDIARSNALVLTVSVFSKNELQEIYHIPEHRIVVTPLGLDVTYSPRSAPEQARVRHKYELEEAPFVLYMGRLEEKKNMYRFVDAFLSYAEGHEHVQCALAGSPGFGWSKVEALIHRHPQGHRVRMLGYVDEGDKPALLSAASCYIQPSLYEGFGLPVLEAMACGTMVISSTAGSLPEVGGDAVARYVNPASTSSIAEGLEGVLALSSVERREYSERGRRRAADFTWNRTAAETLAAIERYG